MLSGQFLVSGLVILFVCLLLYFMYHTHEFPRPLQCLWLTVKNLCKLHSENGDIMFVQVTFEFGQEVEPKISVLFCG